VGNKKNVKSGAYYVPVGKEGGNAASKVAAKVEKLWDWQEEQFKWLGY
jgi:hypothetical protein